MKIVYAKVGECPVCHQPLLAAVVPVHFLRDGESVDHLLVPAACSRHKIVAVGLLAREAFEEAEDGQWIEVSLV